MPSHQRETRSRAANAQRRDTSAAAAASGSIPSQDSTAFRGSVARSHSIEPWDTAETGGRSKRAAATGSAAAASAASAGAAGSTNRRESRRTRHGGTAAPPAADGSSSSSSGTANYSGEPHKRSAGVGPHSSSSSSARQQHSGGSVGQRRSSNVSQASNCSEDAEEEEATCPLCLETLDETDRGLFPCECGYQVCLWCLHHIRDHLANKCPACRRDYDEKKFKYDQSKVLELTKQIGRKSRDKVCGASDPTRSGSSGGGGGSSSSSSSNRTAGASGTARGGTSSSSSTSAYSSNSRNAAAQQQQAPGANRRGSREAPAPAPAQAAALKDVRVIQRCLVYVIGIPPSIAKKEILRRHEFFGQYGKVLQIVVNKNQGADSEGFVWHNKVRIYSLSLQPVAFKAAALMPGAGELQLYRRSDSEEQRSLPNSPLVPLERNAAVVCTLAGVVSAVS
ncbi:hypothetical protein EPH_0031260 [Eimeria praecox]|uniref:RING-type domain-containing protein n=1 Tax=Eimeria praecox TaxID=51316 RepID=U6G1W5_9EIME|nr:hypothetical protein EPH_0031260 [Eimeria praecox]